MVLLAYADDEEFSENETTHSRLPSSLLVRFILQDSSAGLENCVGKLSRLWQVTYRCAEIVNTPV